MIRGFLGWIGVLVIACVAAVAFFVWSAFTKEGIQEGGCQRIQIIAASSVVARDLGIEPETVHDFIDRNVPDDAKEGVTVVVGLVYASNLTIPQAYENYGEVCRGLASWGSKLKSLQETQ